ncbi:MAG: hypothetical protein AB8F94_10100 [Saprospiraceae bacterium]
MSCNSYRNMISLEEKNQGWRIVKVDKNDEPTWIIYSRKLVGTKFLEFKIVGDIKSSPAACVASFRQEIYNQADDLKNKKYPTYEIVEESKYSLLTYVIHHEPFPLKNTEMSVRYLFYKDTESAAEEIKWIEAWEEDSVPPPSKKLSRVQTFRGFWQFSPISIDHCKAVNSVQFNPKKMPRWLVSPMVTKFLIKGIEDIRETTSK